METRYQRLKQRGIEEDDLSSEHSWKEEQCGRNKLV